MTGSRQLIRTCGPGVLPAVLVRAADPDAGLTVSDATTCLPVGWFHLGDGAADFDPTTWEIERLQLAMESTSRWAGRLRVGDRLALCLDVFDGVRHDRIWLPSTELVAPGWEFAVYPGADGQRVHLFTEYPAVA